MVFTDSLGWSCRKILLTTSAAKEAQEAAAAQAAAEPQETVPAEDMVKDVTEIAVVATSKNLQKQFESQTNVTIRYESLDKAKKALNKDKIAGYVSVSLKKGRYEARYHGKGSIDETSKAAISTRSSSHGIDDTYIVKFEGVENTMAFALSSRSDA